MSAYKQSPNRRARRARTFVAALLVTAPLPAAIGAHAAVAAPAAIVSTVPTAGTGWFGDEAALSPALVGSASFGERWSAPVNGQVYAPLVQSGSTIIAATENNEVDGLNLGDGSKLWTTNLGQPWPAATISCADLAPNIGVTGRPVLSPDGSIVYLVSKTYAGTDVTHPNYYMHALSVATGAEQSGWPVLIAGNASNNPAIAFNPEVQLQRPGLLLMNGVVYAAFGSLCDNPLARGWLAAVDTSTAQLTSMWTTEATITASKPLGTIWEGGGELVSDGPGQIIFSTGNGVVPNVGDTAPTNLGNSVVRVSVDSTGAMHETDFFAPYNAYDLNATDQDLGSGAPTILPSIFGTASVPSVILQGGKPGYLNVINAASFGGRGSTTDNLVQSLGQYGRFSSQPAVYPGEGGWAYVVTEGPGPIMAFKSTPLNGLPHLSKKGQTTASFSFSSSSAIVTSDGTTPGSALVWAVQLPTKDGLNANLLAFNAIPASGVLTQVFSAPVGTAVKFGRPLAASGNVLVGTRDGQVLDFGALNTTVSQPLVASTTSLDLGSTQSGTQATGSFTLQNPNSTPATISAISGPTAPFSVGGPTVGTIIPANASVTVPVAFAPNSVSVFNSSVSYTTTAGTTTVNLSGTGTSSAPSTITIGDPTGGGWTLNGSAKILGGVTQLTSATTNQAGDVVYPTAVSSAGLNATFTTNIGGGTGADGLTFALLDATTNTPTSLGAKGGGLGFGGLTGVAVALDTYKSGTNPSNNFIGIPNGFASGHMSWATTSTAVPPLRVNGLVWQITTDNAGHITVSVNGSVVLTATVTLPPNVYLAFTGGTGASMDVHSVSNVAITANS